MLLEIQNPSMPEEFYIGRGSQETNTTGDLLNNSDHVHLLDFDSAGMETGDVPPVANGKTPAARPRSKPRAKPKSEGNPTEIPPGN